VSVTVAQALRKAALRLAEEGREDAEYLMAQAVGQSRSWLFAHANDELPADALAQFEQWVTRRERGEPVAYLLGTRGFWRLDLFVTPDTLIPRPETERLVELALDRLPPHAAKLAADLGTGSGAIALALAHERPSLQVLATDVSPAALAVAKRNAIANGLERVQFAQGAWLSALGGRRFDLIVSNPPYIEDRDPHLERGDLRFEPRSALASGSDGLDDLRIIIAGAPAHLVPGGSLLVEHGWNQGERVARLFVAAGFSDVATVQDWEGRDRVTLGRMA
jgi:release factor glutamine methyltransferase